MPAATSGRWLTRKPRSSSMPTDTKKAALKRIWSGRISPSACWLNRLSLTTRPARNAPRERLTPARLVRNAVPKQMAMTESRNSSGEHVRATCSRTSGMSLRAIRSTATMIPPALASAQTTSLPEPPVPPSIGTTSTITTTARSWKIRMPRPIRPCAVLVSFRSASSLSTMAVELRETRKPVKRPLRQSTPNSSSRSRVPSEASTTWRPPPAKIAVFISASRSRLNSMPMVKSRSITPSSAVASTTARSCTRPSALGPMTTPATRKPTIGTSPSRKQT